MLGAAYPEGTFIRWGFDPEAGYPSGGFTLTYDPETALNPISIPFPESPNMMFDRLRYSGVLTAALAARYEAKADELYYCFSILAYEEDGIPQHLKEFPEYSSGDYHVKMKVLDALHLACLDPFAAIMAGLAFFVPGIKIQPAKIAGYWGNATWPKYELDWKEVNFQQGDALIQQGLLQLSPALGSVFNYTGNGQSPLSIAGEKSGVQALFSAPVEQFVVSFEFIPLVGGSSLNPADFSAIVDDSNYSHPQLRISISDQSVQITVENLLGNPNFSEVRLQGPAGIWTNLSVAYRKRLGLIGAPVTGVSASDAGAVVRPRIFTPQIVPQPRLLDENGQLSPLSANVSPLVYIDAPPEEINKPIGLYLGRSNTATATKNRLNEQFSLYRSPKPLVVLPGLNFFANFNESAENLKTGELPAFSMGSGKYEYLSKQQGHALALDGAYFLTYTNPFNLLFGQNLSIHIEIARFLTAIEPYQTILSTGFNDGIWIGLKRNNHGYSPCVRIKGQELTLNHIFQYVGMGSLSMHITQNNLQLQCDDKILTNAPAIDRYANLVLNNEWKVGLRLDNLILGADTNILNRKGFKGLVKQVHIWQSFLSKEGAEDLLRIDGNSLMTCQKWHQLMLHFPHHWSFETNTSALILNTRDEPGLTVYRDLGKKILFQCWIKHDIPPDTSGKTDIIDILAIRNNRLIAAFASYTFETNITVPSKTWVKISVYFQPEQLVFYVNHVESARITTGQSYLGAGPATLRWPTDSKLSIYDLQIWKNIDHPDKTLPLLAQAQYTDRGRLNGTAYYAAQGLDLFGRLSSWSTPVPANVQIPSAHFPPRALKAEWLPLEGRITRVEELIPENQAAPKGWLTTFTLPAAGAPGHLPFTAPVFENLKTFLVNYRVMAQGMRPTWGSSGAEFTQQPYQILEVRPDSTATQMTVLLRKAPFAQLIPQTGDILEIAIDYYFLLSFQWTGMQQLYDAEMNHFRGFLQNEGNNDFQAVIAEEPVQTRTDQFLYRVITDSKVFFQKNEFKYQTCIIEGNRFLIEGNDQNEQGFLILDLKIYQDNCLPRKGQIVQLNFLPRNAEWRDREQVFGAPDTRVLQIPGQLPLVMQDTSSTPARSSFTATPLTSSEWNRIRDGAGIDGISPANLYAIKLPVGLLRLSGAAPDKTIVRAPEVQSALVAKVVLEPKDAPIERWQALNIVYYTSDDKNLTLYAQVSKSEGIFKRIIHGPDARMRFYPGLRYTALWSLPNLPAYTAWVPTKKYPIAAQGYRQGTAEKSPLTTPFVLVGVDRHVPPPPPKPEIGIFSKAGFDKKSKVKITWSWSIPESVGIYVYRATDHDIFTRDMECRRKKIGYYKSISDVFEDDRDFNAWLAAMSHRSEYSGLGNLLDRMFRPLASETKFDSSTITDDDRQQDALTLSLWRRWYERFYLALPDDEDVRDISKREGNETAFTLIHRDPLYHTTEYEDSVDGTVRNRYYYRLKSMNPNLLQSAVLGEPSDGKAPEVPALPPAAPAFTKVIPGDRKVTLHWALSNDPDLSGYRLYRAETAEELEDLRWFGEGTDPRVVAEGEVPLLRSKTEGASSILELSRRYRGVNITGVYAADAFVYPVPGTAPGAASFNLLREQTEGDTGVKLTLRKCPPGKRLILAVERTTGQYELAFGETNVFELAHESITQENELDPPVLESVQQFSFRYTDKKVYGAIPYCYQLLAWKNVGAGERLYSPASELFWVKPLEESAPEMPRFAVTKTPAEGGTDTVLRIEPLQNSPNLEYAAFYYHPDQENWIIVQPWSLANAGFTSRASIGDVPVEMVKVMVRSISRRDFNNFSFFKV